MPPEVAAVASGAVAWLATYALHSTALICAAWVVTRWVRLGPVSRDFVWRVALLGGVATATGVTLAEAPPAGLDIVSRGGGDTGIHRIAVRRIVEVELDGEVERLVRLGDAEGPHAAGPTPLPGDFALTPENDPLPPACRSALRAPAPGSDGWMQRIRAECNDTGRADGWLLLLVGIWLSGAVLGLVGLASGRRAVRALLGSLEEPDARTRAVHARLGAGTPVAVSTHLSAPCVLPGPTIALPARCEEEMEDAELEAVLAHELAHVARRDLWWASLLRLVCALLWLQPLNRLAWRAAREATEEACDDWAVARTGGPRPLAASISRVVQWAASAPPGPVLVSMAGPRPRGVSGRISRILRGPPRSEPRWLRWVAALVVACPLPLLPAVPAPSPLHTAVWVEGESVEATFRAGPEGPTEAVRGRLVVTRIRAD